MPDGWIWSWSREGTVKNTSLLDTTPMIPAAQEAEAGGLQIIG